MKRILTVVAALALVASFSSVSWAITFSQESGFDTSAGTLLSTDAATAENDIRWSTDAAAVPADLVGEVAGVVYPTSPYFNTISWGVANNDGGLDPDASNWGDEDYSALRVLGFTGDATIGEWETISRVFHQNNAISSTLFTLQSGIIRSALTVGTTDVDLVAFEFNETNNFADPCPGSFPNPCPDLFTFNASIFTPVFFTADGQNYKAEFQFANLVNADFEFDGPNVLLWTQEGVTSSLDVQMRLSTVPEPASMMLLGSGLLGMVGLRRKNKKS